MSVLKGRSVRIGAAALALLAVGGSNAGALDPAIRVTPLLATGKTVMDEPIVYPTNAPAKLTTAIVEMAPGSETGWHTHGVPLTGLILKGELTVDYGARGTRTYREGQSVAEAINVPHNGKNTGTGVMRLFVVYIGAEGLKTTIPEKKK
jgi:quercetin dioxygenase-like cupin family protein